MKFAFHASYGSLWSYVALNKCMICQPYMGLSIEFLLTHVEGASMKIFWTHIAGERTF